jgi:putative ABC transport system permease protein
MAGIYPAFVISSFKPALTLKGQQGNAKGKGGIRRALVVAQFAISICLMIATFITFEQLRYLNEIDLGYNKDQVITMPYYNELSGNFDAFYHELTKSASVTKVGRSSRVPTGRLLDSYGDPKAMKGDSLIDIKFDIKTIAVDAEFFNAYDIKMAAGRSFSKDTPSDDSLAYIVNEAVAKQIGWTNLEAAIGKDFMFDSHKGKLVGIVKNFHFESLHQEIVPIVFINRSTNYNVISVTIAGKNMQEGIAHVEKVWKSFLPARPFGYRFISERYAQLYDAEQKQSQLFTTFAGLAIFIASLGLFGLATFNTMQRVKEIGIRKVLGASVGSILGLLSREIVILIIAANLLAWPVAWYFMTQWLDTFAYHVDMSLVAYLLAAIGAILLALITVSSQTIKAAMTNPANTLRYE